MEEQIEEELDKVKSKYSDSDVQNALNYATYMNGIFDRQRFLTKLEEIYLSKNFIEFNENFEKD